MSEQITIEGKMCNLVPVEEQGRIFICEIDGKKYYLGPEAKEKMAWEGAKEWAKSVGGQLMPREVGVLAFKKTEIRKHFQTDDWYWLEDEYRSSYGWCHCFSTGHQHCYGKPIAFFARAVFVE